MQSFQNYLLLAKILNLLQAKYMINDMKYEGILIIIKYSNLEPNFWVYENYTKRIFKNILFKLLLF